MVLFSDISTRLCSLDTPLYSRLHYVQLSNFFATVQRLRPLIQIAAPRRTVGVPSLPESVRASIAHVVSLSLKDVDTLWDAFGDLAIQRPEQELLSDPTDLDRTLAALATNHGVGSEVLISPHLQCTNTACRDHGKRLQTSHKPFLGRMFTVRRGVLPVRVVTLYCKSCQTTYRPNYFVTQADSPMSVRQFHPGVPSCIEASEHIYLDSHFMSLVRAQMAFAHASGDTIARIYNLALSGDVKAAPALDGDHVWQAFYLHALMLDSTRRSELLRLPHRGKQSERLRSALALRNVRMAGTGQPQWAHACDECEKVQTPADPSRPKTRLSACVMDGVTLGHPRCNVKHCVGRLKSPRDRFCEAHANLATICAITGCDLPCTDGMRTCSLEPHRAFELRQRERGQAIFRLRRRMERSVPQASLASEHTRPTNPRFTNPGGSDGADLLDDAEVAALLETTQSGEPGLSTIGHDALPASGDIAPHSEPGANTSNASMTMPSRASPAEPPPVANATDTGLDDRTPLSSTASGHLATSVPSSEGSSVSQARSTEARGTSAPSPNVVEAERTRGANPRPSLSEQQALTWNGIRAWTHNEQLLVRCCGVVISRATFYTAESPSNCLRFLLATFPSHYPRARPSFCFFDNNCILLKHILATGETRLSGMGLPVDVFHAVTKHKDTDEFCKMNCNPATFPELYNALHEWLFNSSAAEQINVWFGQFLPIVREMREENYNFFLDEMIMIHNEWQIGVLYKRGARPRLVPIEELRLPRE